MEKDLKNMALEELTELSRIDDLLSGENIRTRGFVNALRSTARFYFLTLRDQLDTIQCIITKDAGSDEAKAREANLSPEAYIEVIGTVKSVSKPITSCSKKNIEIDVIRFNVLGPVYDTLPFSLKDAAATEKERASNPSICSVAYSHRLDNRFLDFRLPSTQATIRIIDSTMNFFREYLRSKDFTEIKTTKIIGSGSEGGANLFPVDYFGKSAYLTQSPQLYKQMAVIGGLKRVFEVGHVYRAEESNINRYLSEFTGLDIEMEMRGSYIDIIHFIYGVFVHIFDSLKEHCSQEIEIVRQYRHFEDIAYGQEPVIIAYVEAVKMLQDAEVSIQDGEDFSRENERKLGEIVRQRHGVDFFVVKDYPKSVRAFYTYCEPDSKYSHSYDFILRGEEILSGAERISDLKQLMTAIEEKAVESGKSISLESLEFYINAFRFGVPPHAGCGIGLERVLKAYFAFDDIRHFSLFPRDPKRLHP